MFKQLIITGAICAFLAVTLGAFAAHGLKQQLDENELAIWQTAVTYQMYHALGLILIGLLSKSLSVNLNVPGWLMFTGILLFSGSLYTLSLTGIKALGMITPIGGLCFLVAWLWLSLSIIKAK